MSAMSTKKAFQVEPMRPAIPNEQWAPSNRRGIPDGQWPPPRGGSSGNLRDAGGIRRQAAWSLTDQPETKFARNDLMDRSTLPFVPTSSSYVILPASASLEATDRRIQRDPVERASESWRSTSRPHRPGFHSEQTSRSQPSWSERDEPVRGSSGGSYGDVMKRVMEAVIPKSDPVQRLLPVTSDDFPPAAGNRKILREKVPERDDPVEQVIAAGGCDEQEMVSKIRGELEKMKREDWVGYEILLKAVKAINDPASGSIRNSLLANASPAVRSLSTNKLILRALFEDSIPASKTDGILKPSQRSDSQDGSLSKDATSEIPLKLLDSSKVSEKKMPSTSPVPDLSHYSQPRWESWRNLSSREPEKPRSAPIALPSDSWRSSVSNSPSSTSWRNNSKDASKSDLLTAKPPLASRPLGRSDAFESQRTVVPITLTRSQINDRIRYESSFRAPTTFKR